MSTFRPSATRPPFPGHLARVGAGVDVIPATLLLQKHKNSRKPFSLTRRRMYRKFFTTWRRPLIVAHHVVIIVRRILIRCWSLHLNGLIVNRMQRKKTLEADTGPARKCSDRR
jgi:hypothetical protein